MRIQIFLNDKISGLTRKNELNFLRRREAVIGVLLFCDYKSDESYTPSKIDILCGNDPNDLRWILKPSDSSIDLEIDSD